MSHVFSPENQAAIKDLVETSLKVATDGIEDEKRSHHKSHWPTIVERHMAAHKDRVIGIERYFFELETGDPF